VKPTSRIVLTHSRAAVIGNSMPVTKRQHGDTEGIRSRLAVCAALLMIASVACSKNTMEVQTPPPIEISDREPTWSPDGKSIAYFHLDYSGADTVFPTGLYVVDVQTGQSKLIVKGIATTPEWSPDGNHLAFASGVIWTCRPDGSSPRQVTNVTSYDPAWSPSGARIAFDTPDLGYTFVLCAVDSDGKSLTTISVGDSEGWRDPDWGPDGFRVVHTGWPRGSASQDVYVLDLRTSVEHRLISDGYNDMDPAWDPTGALIAWSSYRTQNTAEVWLMDSTGTGRRKLCDGREPAWSPDGTMLAFRDITAGDGEERLFMIGRDGLGKKQLTGR